MSHEPIDPRIHDYLRKRADVAVPADLRVRAFARTDATDTRSRSNLGLGVVGLAAVLAVAVAASFAFGSKPTVPITTPPGTSGLAQVSPSAGAPASAGRTVAPAETPDAGGFPTSVLGMPVVSVQEAQRLRNAGELNGRALAVAGYYFRMYPSCPYPGPYVGPLDGWCRIVAFADTEAAATVCTSTGTGSSCSGWGTGLQPWFMSDTTGDLTRNFAELKPVPIVVIGHSDDPRKWECPPDSFQECSSAFVVDRLAWADGNVIDPRIRDPYYAVGTWGGPISPRLTFDDIATTIGDTDTLLTASPYLAGELRTIDPRWNLTGNQIVWLVRTTPSGADGSDPTRAVTVSVIDDATRQLIDAKSLALDPAYAPARLWTSAIIKPGARSEADDVYAFFRMESEGGAIADDRLISDSSSTTGDGETTIGPDAPLLVDSGTFTLTSWLARVEPRTGKVLERFDSCSTTLNLRALDDLVLSAIFTERDACRWSEPATAPDTFNPY